jgi:DNA polymerase bacteriophage-type
MHDIVQIRSNVLYPAAAASWRDTKLHVLHRDYETRSRAILKTVGTYKYAADLSTEVLCCAYAVDDEPVQLWTPGDPVPAAFIEAATNPAWVVAAHNDAFETAIEQYILAPRYGWPVIPIERHRCTMAAALAAGLPARLGAVADALDLANRKDRAGERLMHQVSKPRRARKGEDLNQVHWFDDDDRLRRLYEYCRQDIAVEREFFGRLPPLSSAEQAIWELGIKINARGFYVDRAFAEAARKIGEAAALEIDQEIAELTAEKITGFNQIAKLQAWLLKRGCPVKSLNRKTIEKKLLDPELVPVVRRVLDLRLGGAQAAVKKIDALLARAGDDDRVRGAFKYHGAATGRWAGEGVQPHNLKRPLVEDLDAAIAAVATGDYQHVRNLYPRPLSVVGDCSRAMICAAPGHVLIGADFSSIESRILAWIAGEEWKLEAYRRFDATHDPRDEPYCETACRIFRVSSGSYTKDSPERNVGKTCDLAFGYMGGINAWRKFEPDQFTDEEVKVFNTEWRTAHPAIRRLWYNVDRTALTAVRERGRVIRCGPILFKNAGAFLLLKLPSGRKLSYPQPRAVGDEQRQHVVFTDNAAGQFKDCRNGNGAYGGLWTENVVSGIARDLLADAMVRIEAAGYPIVLHIHDEIVAEVPEGFGSTDEFTHLMTRKPAWALDLPIAAKAWAGSRYTK